MDKYLIDLKEIGARIKELRKSLNYSQEKFAFQVHISTSYLALLETGKRTASIDVLAQIANSFHISIDYLLFGTHESLQQKNYRQFQSLCANFSENDINNALSLAEFYLINLSKSSK